jgi:hypothetical protein
MDSSTKRVIIDRNGQRFGPYTFDQAREFLIDGRLTEADTAKLEGTEEWLPIKMLLRSPEDQRADAKPEPKGEVPLVPDARATPNHPMAVVSEPPPLPTGTSAWYYSSNGKRTGPVSDEQIRQLIAANTINEHTLVWRDGMSSWAAAYQTDLRAFYGSGPPPLPGEGVDNRIVWTLAFAPIGIAIIDAIVLSSGNGGHSIWLIGYLVNTVLCYIDAEKLKNAGYDTKGMSNWIVIVPVYLFVRAGRLKQNNAYAIVWLVTFFISLFL